MGKLVGVCYICGKPAMFSCSSCGGLVCETHYIAKQGVCVRCYLGLTIEGREEDG